MAENLKTVKMMKFKAFILIYLFFGQPLIGQIDSSGHTYISPEILKKIKADIEKEIPVFKNKLIAKEMTLNQIEFSMDTFRLNKILAKRMDLNYTTSGMNRTVIEFTKAYDQLMNKYYNKLLYKLKKDDKNALIIAQKAWVVFRNAEQKIIWVVNKDTYTGGGTIYSNISIGMYSDLVTKRALEIFNYYENLINPK